MAGYLASVSSGTRQIVEIQGVDTVITQEATGTTSGGYVHSYGTYNSNETRAVFQYNRNNGYFEKLGNDAVTRFSWIVEYTKN